MKKMAALFGVFFSLMPTAWADFEIPAKPEQGVVRDDANILSESTEAQINQMALELEAENGSEIAVLTVESLQGRPIEEFALQVGRTWGVGQEGNDNGLLLLVAPNDREVRIEVGYGLEGAIPDATASLIIQNILVPAFQNGDYEGGVIEATRALTALAVGEAFEIPASSQDFLLENLLGALPALLFVCWTLAILLARSYSWWAGGVIGALFAGFISPVWVQGWAGALQFMVMGGIAGLVFDYLVSKYLHRFANDTASVWWNTSGFSSSDDNDRFGGGSSGGGFGGGSFGGGGASGKW